MAVYTQIDDEAIDALLARYDIGKRRALTGITQGVENTNYRLETDLETDRGGRYILTIYEKRVQAADLPFFLGLKKHLAAKAYPCPSPIADRDGQILQKIQGKPMAIVSFLDGTDSPRPTTEQCQKAGAILARLHLDAANFTIPRPNALGQHAWAGLFDACGDAVNRLEKGLGAQIQKWLDDLEQQWRHDLPRGVIHADLFPDNVLFTRHEISGVIDFYFACQDMYAYDVAITINAWCFDDTKTFCQERYKAMLKGYTDLRPLSEAEETALPILAKGAAMRFFLTRLYDCINTPADAQVKPHDPQDYLTRLRFWDGNPRLIL